MTKLQGLLEGYSQGHKTRRGDINLETGINLLSLVAFAALACEIFVISLFRAKHDHEPGNKKGRKIKASSVEIFSV